MNFLMKNYKCMTCKDDPKGVLGLNSYRACPDCNDLPMTGFEKDRAVYDLRPVLEAVVRDREQRARRADDERKESQL